jgi:phosphoglycolate phosphatase
MIKLVAFDLDGTIGNTIPMCISAFKKAVTPYASTELTEVVITKTFGLSEEGMIKKIVGNDWESALSDFYIIYEQLHILCPHPLNGIKELIEELKGNSIFVALITGKGEKSCAITLQQFGMEGYFDTIATGSPVRNRKAEAMSELLVDYNLHPSEMVYIGDDISDITACSEAGIVCLSAAWIASPSNIEKLEKENQENLFYSIESLREFLIKETQRYSFSK